MVVELSKIKTSTTAITVNIFTPVQNPPDDIPHKLYNSLVRIKYSTWSVTWSLDKMSRQFHWCCIVLIICLHTYLLPTISPSTVFKQHSYSATPSINCYMYFKYTNITIAKLAFEWWHVVYVLGYTNSMEKRGTIIN